MSLSYVGFGHFFSFSEHARSEEKYDTLLNLCQDSRSAGRTTQWCLCKKLVSYFIMKYYKIGALPLTVKKVCDTQGLPLLILKFWLMPVQDSSGDTKMPSPVTCLACSSTGVWPYDPPSPLSGHLLPREGEAQFHRRGRCELDAPPPKLQQCLRCPFSTRHLAPHATPLLARRRWRPLPLGASSPRDRQQPTHRPSLASSTAGST